MADAPTPDPSLGGGQYQKPKPRPQNPVFRMLGMPNFRFKLPSRNWMIFLTVVGSWTGAVVYDKREKKRLQAKWCDLVAHIAQQPLETTAMPRKLTVFLSAPPGDGIGASRRYFKEYVKPVLVAAAMDYDVIEGRKEGDVRYGTAEQIRRQRRKMGDNGQALVEEEADLETVIDTIRQKFHVQPEAGVRGDLVLGRHTWKEYIRGIHEGWLGPIDRPASATAPAPTPMPPPTDMRPDGTSNEGDMPEGGDAAKEKPDDKPAEEGEKKPASPPAAYLSTEDYTSASLSRFTPDAFEPSQTIHQQHLLGFLKTPQRIYNFLNRRHLADQIGRETAAIVLAAHRPYHSQSTSSSMVPDEGDSHTGQAWEQQVLNIDEEPKWHKSARKPREGNDDRERLWASDIVIDERIGERMRKFELDSEEDERASRIAAGLETSRAL